MSEKSENKNQNVKKSDNNKSARVLILLNLLVLSAITFLIYDNIERSKTIDIYRAEVSAIQCGGAEESGVVENLAAQLDGILDGNNVEQCAEIVNERLASFEQELSDAYDLAAKHIEMAKQKEAKLIKKADKQQDSEQVYGPQFKQKCDEVEREAADNLNMEDCNQRVVFELSNLNNKLLTIEAAKEKIVSKYKNIKSEILSSISAKIDSKEKEKQANEAERDNVLSRVDSFIRKQIKIKKVKAVDKEMQSLLRVPYLLDEAENQVISGDSENLEKTLDKIETVLGDNDRFEDFLEEYREYNSKKQNLNISEEIERIIKNLEKS